MRRQLFRVGGASAGVAGAGIGGRAALFVVLVMFFRRGGFGCALIAAARLSRRCSASACSALS